MCSISPSAFSIFAKLQGFSCEPGLQPCDFEPQDFFSQPPSESPLSFSPNALAQLLEQ
jgi:hypothetical protein